MGGALPRIELATVLGASASLAPTSSGSGNATSKPTASGGVALAGSGVGLVVVGILAVVVTVAA